MRQLDNLIINVRLTNFNLFAKLLFTVYCILFTAYSFSQTEYEAPKLTCTRPIGSQTELNWNLPTTANPCFTGYEIYTSAGNKNGPYTLVTTINNAATTSALVNISSATPPYAYFYIINRGSCTNPTPLANKTSDTLFTDKPTAIVLKSVSVVNNQVQINWEPSPSPEVIGYYIYNNLDGSPFGFNNPDTVFGRLTTSYIDTKHNPTSTVVQYAVRAIYTCQSALPDFVQGSITPPELRHTTIRLKNVNAPDNCTQTVSVEWTKYLVGSNGTSVLSYAIETNTDNAGFIIQKTVDNNTLNNVVTDVPYLKHFCIRIKANLDNGSFSFSNEICFDSLNVNQQPQTDYIRNITVENGDIYIEYIKDTLATPYRNRATYRSEDGIIYTGLTSNISTYEDKYRINYKDVGLDINQKTFSYSVKLIDSCSNQHYSDSATALRINIKEKSSNKATVDWKGFEVNNITFTHFRLEKIIKNDTTIVGLFPRTQNTYAENSLFDFTIDSLEEVCYRVTAVFINNNDVAPRETLESHSNIICVQPEPKALVPQAFVPNGYNKTFKPFLIFATAENYSFQIYDRWYHLVFSTNDIDGRWDGLDSKGVISPNDSYIYNIKFKGKNGKDYTQQGTVMLLR